MEPSNKFVIEERVTATAHMYNTPVMFHTNYDIKRVKDDKIITTKTDYLEALKYLEALEDRSWLVS